MATATAATAPSTSSSLLLCRPLPPNSTAAYCLAPPRCRACLRTARQVAVSSVSPSPSPSPDVADEEATAAPKLGKRVRVMTPVRVYHVPKAPNLDLRGMEGVVKQYVGVWKGKRITANRPFSDWSSSTPLYGYGQYLSVIKPLLLDQ
ncbi:ferredoxin-thioredoxin reductase, variable chain, chloroplastic-like [Triticum aestivum]|uniref:ferredoxin-thioredoxin reductase, variable chain, chloroplastic-like n=1 Tax=Triticum aestivum TaxID=4565 RepID=UPI0008454195|nr:ferredoxin-thioredoxin reductase, variable chain, chloroplastic-like [Triticum aestivum]